MQNLDRAFSALADPTRRAILAQLAMGEAMITDLARPFELTQPAISRHIKILEHAGLIRRRAEGTRRLCSLQVQTVNELEHWLSELRRVLEANYSRLDRLLASIEPTDELSTAGLPKKKKGTARHATSPKHRRR